MEGPLFRRSWFDDWESVYVRFAGHFMAFYENDTATHPLDRYPLFECSVKPGTGRLWGRSSVFRLTFCDKSLYLSVPRAADLDRWILSMEKRITDSSILIARPLRSSPIRSAEFGTDAYADILAALLESPENPEFQVRFADACGDFLTLVNSQALAVFARPDSVIPGIRTHVATDRSGGSGGGRCSRSFLWSYQRPPGFSSLCSA
jgi:hypothetical protein